MHPSNSEGKSEGSSSSDEEIRQRLQSLSPSSSDGNRLRGQPKKNCEAQTVYVKKSTLEKAGFGLFACTRIPKGTMFMMYQGVVYTEKQLRKAWPQFDELNYNTDYMIKVGTSPLYIDAADPRFSSMARYANDCNIGDKVKIRIGNKFKKVPCQLNAQFTEFTNHNVFLESLMDIDQGDEILVGYGPEYWTDDERLVTKRDNKNNVFHIPQRSATPPPVPSESNAVNKAPLPLIKPKNKAARRSRKNGMLPLHEQAVFRTLILLQRAHAGFKISLASIARVAYEFFRDTGDETERDNWKSFEKGSSSVTRGLKKLVNTYDIALRHASETGKPRDVLYSMTENAKETPYYEQHAATVLSRFVIDDQKAISILSKRFHSEKYEDEANTKHIKQQRRDRMRLINETNKQRKEEQKKVKNSEPIIPAPEMKRVLRQKRSGDPVLHAPNPYDSTAQHNHNGSDYLHEDNSSMVRLNLDNQSVLEKMVQRPHDGSGLVLHAMNPQDSTAQDNGGTSQLDFDQQLGQPQTEWSDPNSNDEFFKDLESINSATFYVNNLER
jgi:hypothetical protein